MFWGSGASLTNLACSFPASPTPVVGRVAVTTVHRPRQGPDIRRGKSYTYGPSADSIPLEEYDFGTYNR